jgi:hypothetical protein
MVLVKAMNNRNIIIVVIFIVLVVLVGIFAFSMPHNNQNEKINTKFDFLSQESLKNGEAVQFILKDVQDKAIPSQNVTITFIEDGENQTYSIITDNEGKGSLVLNNEAPGSYEISVFYNGTVTYNGCTAKQKITIEEGTAEVSSDSSSESSSSEPVQSNSSAGTSLYNGNSSSSQNLHYDSQYNFYYDDNGIIRGGQSDGMSADYVRNSYESGDMVDEDGNLQ